MPKRHPKYIYTEFKKTKGVSTIDYIFFKKIHGIKPVLIINFNRYIYIYIYIDI